MTRSGESVVLAMLSAVPVSPAFQPIPIVR